MEPAENTAAKSKEKKGSKDVSNENFNVVSPVELTYEILCVQCRENPNDSGCGFDTSLQQGDHGIRDRV